jgi:protein-histidine pros-kinase
LIEEKNRALEEANVAKVRFLASMSHELRTPLNAIIGFSGTLMMELPGPLNDEQTRQLKTVDRSARHLLSLINDMLDVARIESGKLELRAEPVELCQVVQEVTSSLRALAEDKGLRLETRLPDMGFSVVSDRRAVYQILVNLVNNAIKYTDSGYVRIDVVSRRNGSASVDVDVVDTGIGIREQDFPKLFRAFEQIDSSNTKRFEGAGLGLHLSQKLAELIGGSLRVSTAFGKGSTFTLTLPDASVT